MAFNDFRDPIEYVVNQYFEKKKYLNANLTPAGENIGLGGQMPDESLPEYPVHIVRNDEGVVTKIIYGDTKDLQKILSEGLEGSILIWQEELIRDDTGKTIAIDKTYPDGIVSRINLVRQDDTVTDVEIGEAP